MGITDWITREADNGVPGHDPGKQAPRGASGEDTEWRTTGQRCQYRPPEPQPFLTRQVKRHSEAPHTGHARFDSAPWHASATTPSIPKEHTMTEYLSKITTTGLPMWQSILWWVAGLAASTAALFIFAN